MRSLANRLATRQSVHRRGCRSNMAGMRLFLGFSVAPAMLLGAWDASASAGAWNRYAFLLAAGTAELDPDFLSFGEVSVGSIGNRDVMLTNTGDGILTVNELSTSQLSFFIGATNCSVLPAQLDPGESCSLRVGFAPDSIGDFLGQLTVVTDDPAYPELSVSLSGTGTGADLILSTESIAFGEVPVSTQAGPLPVTLESAGNIALSVTAVEAPAQPFAASSTCPPPPFELAPAATCTVSFTFAPTEGGPFGTSSTIVSDALSGNRSITVSGTGIAPVAMADPPELQFGRQRIGSVKGPMQLRIENAGTANLVLGAATFATGVEYSLDADTCSHATLQPAALCSMDIYFMPAEAGLATDQLVVPTNAPEGELGVGVSGVGFGDAVFEDGFEGTAIP